MEMSVGDSFVGLSLDEKEELWQQTKSKEKNKDAGLSGGLFDLFFELFFELAP